jgi:hypothetical protein
MGVPQGKNLGRLLGVIRDARLNGEAKTRKEEQDLVNRWLAKSKYRS